jgi:DNA-binding transcriptional MerR regulator
MKELVQATGVPKSTIILYVNTGLLHQPVRTSRNMAYYHPSSVGRIDFIKRTQARYRLPLKAIKGLLKAMDSGQDVTPLLELQTALFGIRGEQIEKSAFCETTGLTGDQVDRLCRARLLNPMTDDRFDAEDQAVGRLLKKGLDLGIPIAALSFYPELAQLIVEQEIDLRRRCTEPLAFEKDAALTLELTRMARGLRSYVIDRVMQKRLMTFKGLKNRKTNMEQKK